MGAVNYHMRDRFALVCLSMRSKSNSAWNFSYFGVDNFSILPSLPVHKIYVKYWCLVFWNFCSSTWYILVHCNSFVKTCDSVIFKLLSEQFFDNQFTIFLHHCIQKHALWQIMRNCVSHITMQLLNHLTTKNLWPFLITVCEW